MDLTKEVTVKRNPAHCEFCGGMMRIITVDYELFGIKGKTTEHRCENKECDHSVFPGYADEKMNLEVIHGLKNKLAIAKDALEFYANKKHIVCCEEVNWVEPTESDYNTYDVNFIEEGQKAREALERMEKQC